MALYDPIYGASGQPVFQYPALPTVSVNPTVPTPAVAQAPAVKIITVAGEAAAKSMKLAPGSTLLASDENDAIIWCIKANEVGPNTVIPIPYDPAIFSGSPPAADLSAFEKRFDTIEDELKKRLANIEERMNRYESNHANDKQHTGGANGNGKR